MTSTNIGLRCLEKVMTMPGFEVVGIVTNPAVFSISYQPQGVKNVLHVDFRPVAERLGIPIFIMERKMTEPDLIETIRGWNPDFIIVVGWYHMIPQAIRSLAPVAGLHASLLPDYSGGAPLVWAVVNGETRTGITFFMINEKVDNGDIIGQEEVSIYLNDSILILYSRIEEAALRLIEKYLPQFARGTARLIPQDERKRRILPQRCPDDGEIDWTHSALQIYNFIRAQTKPYPGAFTFCGGERLSVWEAKLFDYIPHSKRNISSKAGEILEIINEGPLQGLLIATASGDHPLLLTVVGCKDCEMISGIEYARGRVVQPGIVLGRRR